MVFYGSTVAWCTPSQRPSPGNLRPVASDANSGGRGTQCRRLAAHEPLRIVAAASPRPCSTRARTPTGVWWTGRARSPRARRLRSGCAPAISTRSTAPGRAYVQITIPATCWAATPRYLQYRVDLATTDPDRTPVFESISIDCQGGPDLVPPVISNLVATPGPLGTTADITWDHERAGHRPRGLRPRPGRAERQRGGPGLHDRSTPSGSRASPRAAPTTTR